MIAVPPNGVTAPNQRGAPRSHRVERAREEQRPDREAETGSRTARLVQANEPPNSTVREGDGEVIVRSGLHHLSCSGRGDLLQAVRTECTEGGDHSRARPRAHPTVMKFMLLDRDEVPFQDHDERVVAVERDLEALERPARAGPEVTEPGRGRKVAP